MKFIFSYMKKYRWFIALTMLVKFLGTFSELLLPYVLEYMIDYVAPTRNVRNILLFGGLMLLIAVITRVLNAGANQMAVSTAKKSIYEMRQDLFTKTMNLSGEDADAIGLPSLISRMTSDSYNVQGFMQHAQTLGVRSPILLFGGIIVTLTMDRGLALILIIASPILFAFMFFIYRKGIPLYVKVQEKLDDVVRVMRENITGVRVVKALSKEAYEKRRYTKANEAMSQEELKASVVMSLPMPVMSLVMNICLSVVLLVGAIRVNNGNTQPGVILAFLTYFQMILMGVMILNRFFLQMSKANASSDRIRSVIEKSDGLERVPEEKTQRAPNEDFIIFDDVSFSYGENEATDKASFAGEEREKTLEHISFSLKKGGSLGIIGGTGCGKTTLVNLLMRFYDVDEGAVYVDGKDIRTYSLDSLRKRFGVVFQNDVIFADTISGNIVFGRDVDEKAMNEAAEDALAASFIRGYDDGFAHLAAIRGANFSGGQKQRLLISRALAAKPEILILDDSSSALDYKTDAMLRKNIRVHHQDATTIVVAQRISSIMSLDNILVLHEGRIIGCGKHEELLSSCKEYQEIFETQMGEV